MPQSAQAKKRVRQDEVRRLHNRSMRSAMRTAVRRVEEACEAKNQDEARAALQQAMKRIDKCAKSNILHKNTASRQKSSLTRRVNALGA